MQASQLAVHAVRYAVSQLPVSTEAFVTVDDETPALAAPRGLHGGGRGPDGGAGLRVALTSETYLVLTAAAERAGDFVGISGSVAEAPVFPDVVDGGNAAVPTKMIGIEYCEMGHFCAK
jgi:hypothetical protein